MKTDRLSGNFLHFNPIFGASSSLSTKSSPPHERKTEEIFPLQLLPIEIIDPITKYLKICDLFELSSASRTFQNIIFHDLQIWKSRTNLSFQNRTELHGFLDLLYRVGKSSNRSFSFHNLYHLNDFDISLCNIPTFQSLLPIRVTDLLRNSPKEAWDCFLEQANGKRAEDTRKNIIVELHEEGSERSISAGLKDAIYLRMDVSLSIDLLRQENCTELKCLDLFHNTSRFFLTGTELLNRIATLQSLEHLRIRKTNATRLPREIGNLSSLVTLDLGRNCLLVLSTEIGSLSSLATLNLEKNLLTDLPREIGKLSSLVTLDLSGNVLTTLPTEIGNLYSLVTLDLTANNLTVLPPEIGNLPSLGTLNLAANNLTALPPEIGKLSSLVTLNLAANNLTVLPPEIGKLSSLRKLNLVRNQLSVLPREIGNLLFLETLTLDRIQLTYSILSLHFCAFISLTALRIAKQFEGTIMQAMP